MAAGAFTKTRFVGRERELAQLQERLDDAADGRGSTVMVAGEPGVGKTRLALEFCEAARGRGWLVLTGREYDSEGLPPYLCFVEAIAELLRERPEYDLEGLIEGVGDEIRLLLPSAKAPVRESEAGPNLSPDVRRYQLFESVADLFIGLAPRLGCPGVLLFLDDLHWADKSTLLMLEHLARRLTSSRALTICAFRPTDVGPSHPLTDVLAELAREGLGSRISIEPFDLGDTASMVDALADGRAEPAAVAEIHARTGGNAFFVQEVVRGLLAEGRSLAALDGSASWPVPETLREVIGGRLRRLSAEARALLDAGAVLGDGFGFELAAAVSGRAAESMIEALEEAVAAGIVHEDGDPYRFGHPLLQRTIYDALSLPRRQALHLRAAEAIEHLSSGRLVDASVATLAYHYGHAGGAFEKVFEYSLRAAEAAARAFAWQEAAGHYERAAEVIDRTGCSDIERLDFLLAFSDVLRFAGQPRRASEDIAQQAFALAESLQDAPRAVRACQIALDSIEYHGAMGGSSTPAYQAWAEKEDRYAAPGTAARVHADVSLARVAYSKGAKESYGWPLFRRALDTARQVGDPQWMFFALFQFLNPHCPPELYDEKARAIEESLAWPRDGVSPQLLGAYLDKCAEVHLSFGRRDASTAAGVEAAALAGRTGDPSLLARTLWRESLAASLDGRLTEALAAADETVRFGTETSRPGMAGQAASLRWRPLIWLGRVSEIPGVAQKRGDLGGLSARVAAEPRDTDARAELQAQLAAGLSWLQYNLPLGGLLNLLGAALSLGEQETAAALSARLAPAAHLFNTPTLEVVAHPLGKAAILCGRPAEARQYYGQALEVAQKLRFRPGLALIHLDLGDLLLKHYPRERAEALSHLDFAIQEFESMGMQTFLDRASRLRGRRNQRNGDSGGSAYPDGLTEREVEVLRLVAQGKSNREMAEALFLSPRTVERHVTNIYLKIGAHTKAQATSYALHHNLT